MYTQNRLDSQSSIAPPKNKTSKLPSIIMLSCSSIVAIICITFIIISLTSCRLFVLNDLISDRIDIVAGLDYEDNGAFDCCETINGQKISDVCLFRYDSDICVVSGNVKTCEVNLADRITIGICSVALGFAVIFIIVAIFLLCKK